MEVAFKCEKTVNLSEATCCCVFDVETVHLKEFQVADYLIKNCDVIHYYL